MQISDKIDVLIDGLQKIKPYLISKNDHFAKSFETELEKSIEQTSRLMKDYSTSEVIETKNSIEKESIPSWVDTNYSYDLNKPRKPNIRELSEALAGCTLEELHSNSPKDYYEITSRASDLLNNVIGSNEDTRDWHAIMDSGDIVNSARIATAKLYAPVVDILSDYDENGNITNQYAALKTKNGDLLKTLDGSNSVIEETLLNFGASKKSVPSDLESRIQANNFDNRVLDSLNKFKSSSTNLEDMALQTTLDAISDKLSIDNNAENL